MIKKIPDKADLVWDLKRIWFLEALETAKEELTFDGCVFVAIATMYGVFAYVGCI